MELPTTSCAPSGAEMDPKTVFLHLMAQSLSAATRYCWMNSPPCQADGGLDDGGALYLLPHGYEFACTGALPHLRSSDGELLKLHFLSSLPLPLVIEDTGRIRYCIPVTIGVKELPPMIKRLCKLVGFCAAMRVVELFGGSYIVIPVKPNQSSLLESVVGADGLAALIGEFLPGVPTAIPKFDSVLRQARHARVLSLSMSGKSMKEVSLLSGYSMRSVATIVGESGEPRTSIGSGLACWGSRQGVLFRRLAVTT